MATTEELIRSETNPEILRELALFINDQAKLIAEENKKLRAEREKEEAQKQAWLNRAIEVHLHKLRKRFFEKGRETLGQKSRDRRQSKDDQLLLHAQSLAGNTPKSESAKLPTEEVLHHADEETIISMAKEKDESLSEKTAQVSEMKNFYEVATEITISEVTYKKVIHKRQKYKVQNKVTKKETIVTAPGPFKLLPGSRFSVDFALKVVTDKFMYHLPYERQQREMKRLGLNVPVMTLFRLAEQVATHHNAVAEDIMLDIRRAPLACHLDETPWPILSNHDDDGRMWVLSNQAGSYYRFEPTRSGDIADELLKDYVGCILTDKYSGYLRFRGSKFIKWGLCWSHVRREFLDLETVYPQEVIKIVTLIDDLFKVEHLAKTWDELKILRQKQSKKKVDEIKSLLEEYRAQFFDRDDFCKAINYVLSAWPEFTAFIENVELPLSNNDAERALRHAVVGRKNFNGSKTINGADVSATLYTIVESCKKVELDPITYMKYVIGENQNDRKPLTPLERARQMRGIDGRKNEIESDQRSIPSAQ